MRIKCITSQHKRDFRADFECEHCEHIERDKRGYDDAYFHNEVIPEMVCPRCSKRASGDYQPLPTRYPEGYSV